MSITINAVSYPDLQWQNRNQVAQVAMSMKRALNGAPSFNVSPLSAGVELLVGSSDAGVSRADFNQLRTLAATAALVSVELDGVAYTCMFDHRNGPAVTGEDVFQQVEAYGVLTQVTLKLLTA